MTDNLATNQSRNRRLLNEMENCFLVSIKLLFDGFPSQFADTPPIATTHIPRVLRGVTVAQLPYSKQLQEQVDWR